MSNWIEEKQGDSLVYRYTYKEKLFSGKSAFQKVEVVDSVGYGKMLFNDDLVMISERDEFIYHDMISHVALYTHPNPKKVLIIGGGDGGTMREVLRHSYIDECVMVEIDEMVVDACKKYIPLTACAFANEKANLKIEDGVKFVAETDEKFDIVLVDSTDPIGPATPLFGPGFYKNVNRILNEDGIVVSQGESPFYHAETQRSLLEILKQEFPRVHIFNFNNLTYPGGIWSFSFASKGPCPKGDFQAARYHESGMQFQYYNEAVHKAAFCLPEFQQRNLHDLLSDFKQ